MCALSILHLQADPFDLDAQRKIEEQITAENVAANLEQAMEQAPEMVVGSVFMLYVNWCVIIHSYYLVARCLCLRMTPTPRNTS